MTSLLQCGHGIVNLPAALRKLGKTANSIFEATRLSTGKNPQNQGQRPAIVADYVSGVLMTARVNADGKGHLCRIAGGIVRRVDRKPALDVHIAAQSMTSRARTPIDPIYGKARRSPRIRDQDRELHFESYSRPMRRRFAGLNAGVCA